MKLDVTQGLIGVDGKPVQDDGESILLRTVCINALMATLEEDRNLSGEDKLSAWTLAKRLQDADQPDLKPEELTKLKERVGKCFSPAIVGPVFLILNDPTPEPPSEE